MICITGFANEHNQRTNVAAGHAHVTSESERHVHEVLSGGDSETRPVNAYVNWIIKY